MLHLAELAHLGLGRGQKASPGTGDAGEAPEQCEEHSAGTAMEEGAPCLCVHKQKTHHHEPTATASPSHMNSTATVLVQCL